jgi:hypothetical protein
VQATNKQPVNAQFKNCNVLPSIPLIGAAHTQFIASQISIFTPSKVVGTQRGVFFPTISIHTNKRLTRLFACSAIRPQIIHLSERAINENYAAYKTNKIVNRKAADAKIPHSYTNRAPVLLVSPAGQKVRGCWRVGGGCKLFRLRPAAFIIRRFPK